MSSRRALRLSEINALMAHLVSEIWLVAVPWYRHARNKVLYAFRARHADGVGLQIISARRRKLLIKNRRAHCLTIFVLA